MGERLHRKLANWDARNQATVQQHNERAGGTWEAFDERTSAGPRWAYAVGAVPVVGWVGVVVTLWAHRRRRNGSA